MTSLGPRLTDAVSDAASSAFDVVARIRHGKPLHPRGIVVPARVDRTGTGGDHRRRLARRHDCPAGRRAVVALRRSPGRMAGRLGPRPASRPPRGDPSRWPTSCSRPPEPGRSCGTCSRSGEGRPRRSRPCCRTARPRVGRSCSLRWDRGSGSPRAAPRWPTRSRASPYASLSSSAAPAAPGAPTARSRWAVSRSAPGTAARRGQPDRPHHGHQLRPGAQPAARARAARADRHRARPRLRRRPGRPPRGRRDAADLPRRCRDRRSSRPGGRAPATMTPWPTSDPSPPCTRCRSSPRGSRRRPTTSWRPTRPERSSPGRRTASCG